MRRNITAFGGDPAKVTIFGQSGGGVSVFNHFAMPASHGLFARAIAQSGCPLPSVDTDEALRVTRQVARGLGVAPTVEGLAGVPVAKTVDAAMKAVLRFARGLLFGDRRSLLLSPFRTVHGTETVPLSPLDGLLAGVDQPDVPLLAGTMRNEMIDLMAALEKAGLVRPLIRRGIRRGLRIDAGLRAGYRNGPRHIEEDNIALLEAVYTDWGFRMPTIRYVEARTAPTWLYEMRWQPETKPPLLGSGHALDLPFVRDDLDLVINAGPAGHDLLGSNPPQKLATTMFETWVRFATTGDAGWHRYDPTDRATMIFDAQCEVVNDAAGAERQAWDGRNLREY